MNVCIVSHVLLHLISGILHDCTSLARNRLLQGGVIKTLLFCALMHLIENGNHSSFRTAC